MLSNENSAAFSQADKCLETLVVAYLSLHWKLRKSTSLVFWEM